MGLTRIKESVQSRISEEPNENAGFRWLLKKQPTVFKMPFLTFNIQFVPKGRVIMKKKCNRDAYFTLIELKTMFFFFHLGNREPVIMV